MQIEMVMGWFTCWLIIISQVLTKQECSSTSFLEKDHIYTWKQDFIYMYFVQYYK